MKVNNATVTYSSIVKIGEDVQKLEAESGLKYLKLHRGVMDVTNIDINSLDLNIDLNNSKLQQYSGNDGYPDLIKNIKSEFDLEDHKVVITPGGMAALDLVINSLSEENFYISNFHWGSWNKILKTHNKNILTFDDFNLSQFDHTDGVVMLCYPSNPTGYCPDVEEIKNFLTWSKVNNVTVVLDLPYYYLFNDTENGLSEFFSENVIVLSSFSKSIGLSGYRVGYIATKNEELYKTLTIRSLYKYNSISTVPQYIISKLLEDGKVIRDYKKETVEHITENINYLKANGLLFDGYSKSPIGPFAIINLGYEQLIRNRISSVPLNNFSLFKERFYDNCSRISVAVNHKSFKEYFDKMLVNEKTTI